MSVGAPGAIGYADAVSRISQIQSQIAGLRTAFTPPAAGTGASGTGTGTAAGATAGSVVAGETMMAGATPMAGAASMGTVATGAPAGATGVGMAGATAGMAPGGTFASALSGALGSAAAGGASAALPAGASTMLTSDQQQFASRLAARTGLDPGVVSAWLLAEESGGAARSRQSESNNDWLNIGYTGSGTFGSGDSVWSDPITAADATAGWLQGKDTIPGYGTASSGIQAILGTVGMPPADQISALQGSGWASSGYPSLSPLYQQVTAAPA